MEKNIGLKETVGLKVTIKLDNETSITGKSDVPLEAVVKDIASAHYAHPMAYSDYNGRIAYALKEIAKGAIDVFKQGYFRDESHEEQIKVYQTLIDSLENKRKKLD